jgi:hypothetical protein
MAPARKECDPIVLNKDEQAVFHILSSKKISARAKRKCVKGGGIGKKTMELIRKKLRALARSEKTPKAVLNKLRPFKLVVDELGDDDGNSSGGHESRLELLGSRRGFEFTEKCLAFIVNYDMEAGTRKKPLSKRDGEQAGPENANPPTTPDGKYRQSSYI